MCMLPSLSLSTCHCTESSVIRVAHQRFNSRLYSTVIKIPGRESGGGPSHSSPEPVDPEIFSSCTHPVKRSKSEGRLHMRESKLLEQQPKAAILKASLVHLLKSSHEGTMTVYPSFLRIVSAQ